MSETKKCRCCGRELPLTNFSRNAFGPVGVCRECVRKTRAARQSQKRDSKNAFEKLKEAKNTRLGEYPQRELLAELKRRGYKWDKMWVERVDFVDYEKI